MAHSRQVKIPIVCENGQCSNFGGTINVISEIAAEDLDLFYENYDGSVEYDYCPICGELGVAEDPILNLPLHG
ncbi:MAG: hypothetical protein QY329_00445 [Anaerolineales bacterium]|nr:MAG: hypothetical protein QY329_00445 [Anaerolineales bacterium]